MDSSTDNPNFKKEIFGKPAQHRIEQYRKEKLSAMKTRQVRVTNWSDNDRLYSGQPVVNLITRSNLHLPKVFEGVQTASAKIGAIPDVKYQTKPEDNDIAIDLMQALLREDLDASEAEITAQTVKIECGLYGRGLLKIIPGNDGCRFELVDTMAFLINPTATSTRHANYCGQQFIFKTLEQLEDDATKYKYDKDLIAYLKKKKASSETPAANSMEKSLKDLRLAYLGYGNVAQMGENMVELTEWYTTLTDKDDHKRFVITVVDDTYILRALPVEEIGLPKRRTNPFVSFATYPRGIVFWTPSVADVLREPNLAIDVTLNQQIDNNTYRNFGMLFVASNSGLKQGSIIPRPLGVTPVTTGEDGDVKKSVWQFVPPEIASAQQTLSTLTRMADNAAGLDATPIEQKGKMPIAQQAARSAQIEAKTNLMRQSYMSMWRDLVELYAECIQKNLTKPRKVKIYASSQLTIEGVTKSNFNDIEFIAKVSPSELSQENKAIRQKAALELYQVFKDDPRIQGQKKLRERVAKEFDLTPQEIGDLQIVDAPQQPQQSAPALQGSNIPQNSEQPQLSSNGQMTAAAVPQAIR